MTIPIRYKVEKKLFMGVKVPRHGKTSIIPMNLFPSEVGMCIPMELYYVFL
jgi:hypothetical protein